MKFFGLSCVLILSLCLPLSAVNLIQNGSFEDVDATPGNIAPNTPLNALGLGGWNVYNTLPGGWSAVTGYGCAVGANICNSAGIELQRNGAVSGITANSGTNYVELDSHPGPDSNAAMTQGLYLTGGVYQLSYFYLPRTSTQGDNGLNVWVDNGVIGVNLVDTADGVNPPNAWTQRTVDLKLEAGDYNFTFGAFGVENTLGAFVDDVSLTKLEGPQEVPEPATMGVLGLGLVALAFARRFRS